MDSKLDRRIAVALLAGLLEAAAGPSSVAPPESTKTCSISAVWDVVESPGKPPFPPAEPAEIELSGPEPAIRIGARRGEPVVIPVPSGSSGRLRLLHPRLWSPSLIVSALDCAGSSTLLSLETHIAGTLSGSLVPEGPGASKNIEGPVTIDFRTAWAARAAAPVERFEGTSDCRTVLEEGTFACLLPEGRWDLAIRTPGYVVTSIRDARVARGRGLDVGAHTVRRGGTVRGWVEKSDVDGGAAGVELRFDLRSVGHPIAALREEQEATAVRTVTDARGGFAVADLPPGSWVIEATAPGYAPALSTGVEVTPGQVLQMREPVRLTRPFDFAVAIDPPHDVSGAPWHLRASRRDARSGGLAEEPAFQGPVTGGIATIRVSIGDRLFLRVVDSAGIGVWFDPDVAVDDEPDRRLDVVIEQVPVAGRVTVGDEPLQATLHFGGRNGAQRAECTSSSEGEFSVTLPRAGEWWLEIFAPESKLQTSTSVEVPAGGSRELLVELPRTSVAGTVVDSAGRAVAGADVQIQTPTSMAEARTDDHGDFELRAFAAGSASLSAEHDRREGRRQSKPIELVVAENESVEGVRLTLLENEMTTGKVVGPHGPIAGAELLVQVTEPADYFNVVNFAQTEIDGSFRVDLARGSMRAMALVFTPGHPLTSFMIQAGSESLLELPGDEGELVLRVGALLSRGYGLVVYQDELAIPLSLLSRWAQTHGVVNPRLDEPASSFRVPSVAPGVYRICRFASEVDLERSAPITSGAPQPARCEEAYLGAGGTLLLDLDSDLD